MTLPRRRSAIVLAGVLFFAAIPARAVVLFGGDGGTTNNLEAPANGAPWEYVASIGENNASGVYLGYGYVLTANHVNVTATVTINGSLYSIDPAYVPLQIGGADLKLLRILGDPMLEPLELIRSQDNDRNVDVTYIGWGQGKGAEVPNQGWNWGGESTYAQRWGLNRTGFSYLYDQAQRPLLVTDFTRQGAPGSFGEDEFSLALGDSGGGLFSRYGNTWRLIGIGVAVLPGDTAFYDTDPNAPGDTPTRSFFVPIEEYRSQIVAAIPEPSTAASLLIGALLLGRRPRRKRQS